MKVNQLGRIVTLAIFIKDGNRNPSTAPIFSQKLPIFRELKTLITVMEKKNYDGNSPYPGRKICFSNFDGYPDEYDNSLRKKQALCKIKPKRLFSLFNRNILPGSRQSY
ncbi:hypothetical protein OCU04_003488 [Sclerotinia nivalis]|uniref:Uncharacterized protein n=1 Tax=Sclerotinia nivalis TaxID=352851 RepID=A0A9X0AVJ5_9HELO|nr:hypothetical protein OCU04_003488 [Sclerotinia nivalis]